jgi:hypothetical protein
MIKFYPLWKWFKNNWFLWLFIILFYTILRMLGYNIQISKKPEPVGSVKNSELPVPIRRDYGYD